MKDNKKKFLIIGILAFVVIGVGAFQFMGSSPAPAPVVAKKAPVANPTPDPAAPKNPLFAMALPTRDPFAQPNLPELQPTPSPTAKPVAPAQPRGTRPIRNTEHMPVGLTGSLPDAMGGHGQPSGPGPVVQAEPQFAYQLTGVIVGERPAAVFSDPQGNQRLVPLGGSLDNDTKIVEIQKGRVTLRYRGKTLRFEMGGNPNAK